MDAPYTEFLFDCYHKRSDYWNSNYYFSIFQDTPLSCEPTLLPEPNHVMLNHLYALSIKDGVMVLSTTQRFKRKYITTLLYKPMGTRTCENI